MKKRDDRQIAIRQIVRSQNVRTQHELAGALQRRGFKCTQATVSRDIADMGLRKTSDGSYVLADDLNMKHMVSDLVHSIERAGNLVVVKVAPGAASGVAAALDAAEMPEVVGTVAGDDTILVIARDEQRAGLFEQTLRRIHGWE